MTTNKATALIDALDSLACSEGASCELVLSDHEFMSFRAAFLKEDEPKMVAFRFETKTGLSVHVKQQSAYE